MVREYTRTPRQFLTLACLIVTFATLVLAQDPVVLDVQRGRFVS